MPVRIVESDRSAACGHHIFLEKKHLLILSFKYIRFDVNDSLMQQTPPSKQEPLGRPPNMEQTDPGEQIPDSPVGAVQLSKVERGLA